MFQTSRVPAADLMGKAGMSFLKKLKRLPLRRRYCPEVMNLATPRKLRSILVTS
jgi:hypothetical protein